MRRGGRVMNRAASPLIHVGLRIGAASQTGEGKTAVARDGTVETNTREVMVLNPAHQVRISRSDCVLQPLHW